VSLVPGDSIGLRAAGEACGAFGAGGDMTDGSGLASVNHVVMLMLENRSFDHMLGSYRALEPRQS